MIEFDENGFIKPYKVIETDLATIERIFVEEIPLSSTRRMIFDSYLAYNEELKRLIPQGFMQWINGSFVTQKRNPNDIDLVTFIDFEQYNAKEKEIEVLRNWRYDKRKGIDGYFVRTFPENHVNRKYYDFDKIEWETLFHKIRQSKNLKGFLQLTF